jgi:gliding motility-associated-like protein
MRVFSLIFIVTVSFFNSWSQLFSESWNSAASFSATIYSDTINHPLKSNLQFLKRNRFIYNAKKDDLLKLTLTSVDPTCELNNGTITATVSGGSLPYKFSLNGGAYQTSGTWFYQAPGNYTINVKDASGAIVTSNITLTNHYQRPIGDFSPVTPTSGCTATDGTLTVNVKGGTPPYQYSLDLINYQPSNLFINLAPCWYVGYAKDANGCLASINTFPLGSSPTCLIFSFKTNGSECGSGGGVDIDGVGGGKPPYTYSKDGINFQTKSKLTGMLPGVDLFYVRDSKGTTQVHAVQIFDYCPLNLIVTSINATCGNNDGLIHATASDGTAPYQFSIDGMNFQTVGDFMNLAAGNYTISVKDATNRTVVKKVVITTGCLSGLATTTNTTCDYNNGTIKVTASNGTEPYQYSIDGNNFQVSNIFTTLAIGNYTVTVKDATGKIATAPAVIGNVPGPTIKIGTTNSDCNEHNGTLTITPIGGTAPFQYSINNVDFQPDSVFTGLYPGGYIGYIIDSNKCNWDFGVFSIYNLCIDFTTTVINTDCNKASGSITVNVTGGTAPYQYSIDGVNFQSSNFFSKLGTGMFNITVKDAAGIQKTKSTEVKQACVNIITYAINSTCGNNNGVIEINVLSGTAPFLYSLDGINYQTKDSFSNVGPGNYSVTVQDAANNVGTTNVTIVAANPPLLSTEVSAATCANDDGSITASVINGKEPFEYNINNGNFSTTSIFRNLSVSAYNITVKDADGCLSSKNSSVPLLNNLYVDAGNDVTICEGKSIGLFASSNGNTFSWSPALYLDNITSANIHASPILTTKYYVTASTDVCKAFDSLTVNVIPAPIANPGKDTAICYGQNVTLNGSGGVSYQWTPISYLSNSTINNPIVIKPPQSIQYNLKVTGASGCSSLNPAFMKVLVTPVAKIFAGNDTNVVINQPIQLHVIDLNHSGFTIYAWSPFTGLNNPFIADPVATLTNDITYTVDATTASGCEASDVINIKAYMAPDIYVPTAFTPNHDGLNDVLKPVPVGIKDFLFFEVFDRWGEMIFYTTDYNKGWSGSVKGIQPQQSTYVWLTKGIDYTGKLIIRKGNVTIIE